MILITEKEIEWKERYCCGDVLKINRDVYLTTTRETIGKEELQRMRFFDPINFVSGIIERAFKVSYTFPTSDEITKYLFSKINN